jgi:hypothetical protein
MYIVNEFIVIFILISPIILSLLHTYYCVTLGFGDLPLFGVIGPTIASDTWFSLMARNRHYVPCLKTFIVKQSYGGSSQAVICIYSLLRFNCLGKFFILSPKVFFSRGALSNQISTVFFQLALDAAKNNHNQGVAQTSISQMI